MRPCGGLQGSNLPKRSSNVREEHSANLPCNARFKTDQPSSCSRRVTAGWECLTAPEMQYRAFARTSADELVLSSGSRVGRGSRARNFRVSVYNELTTRELTSDCARGLFCTAVPRTQSALITICSDGEPTSVSSGVHMLRVVMSGCA